MQTIWDSSDLFDTLAISSPDDYTEPSSTQRGFLFDGTGHTPDQFLDYVRRYDFGSIPPNFVVLHHTYRPSISSASSGPQYDWDAGEAGLDDTAIYQQRRQRLVNIKTYYERVLGWDRGPHLFIDDRYIWLFTPMFYVGIHAAQGNGAVPNYSIGIEVIGYYEHICWSQAIERNVGLAVAALKQRLGTFELVHSPGPGGISSHRDYNKPTCPGKAITEDYYLSVLRQGWYTLTASTPIVEPISTKPVQVHPTFRKTWEQSGGVWLPERLTPGYPTGPAEQEGDTLFQTFERGVVRQDPDGSMHWLRLDEIRQREQRTQASAIPRTLLLDSPPISFLVAIDLFLLGLQTIPQADHLVSLFALYQQVCQKAGLNLLLLFAQMLHETANLTSFWSTQNNFAGIGVTGEWSSASQPGWPYNDQRRRYERGVVFPSREVGVNAHCGRVLAYALAEGEETPEQAALIAQALKWRTLPSHVRGSAKTMHDLAGTWASDIAYGEKVMGRMREILRRA